MKQPPSKAHEPDIPGTLADAAALTPAMREALEAREDIENIRFTGATIENFPIPRAAFRGCVFEKCTFVPQEGLRLDFTDCLFTGCDLAAMSFANGAFQRVRFAGCRGVGAYFTDAYLRNVTFEDCRLSYGNFGMAKCTNVSMVRCDVSHASFGYAAFDRVSFSHCSLSGAELFGAKLKGMDLRTNQIDGIVVGDLGGLAGAKVTPGQACDLALLLGVIIE